MPYLIAARFLQKFSETLGAAEKRGEIGQVDQDDVSGSLLVWPHPEQAVELPVSGLGEGVRAVEINRLARQDLN